MKARAMTRPIVERRRLYRDDPERLLISDEAGSTRLTTARLERICPVEDALDCAIRAHASKYGWPTTKGKLAARAHYDPSANRSTAPAKANAEALFKTEEA